MTLDVGQRVTHTNFHLLKPGTQLTSGNGYTLVMLDNMFIYSPQGWMHPIRALIDQTLTVRSLPTFERGVPTNIDAFRQRMATVIYGQSRLHSVTTGPATDAIRALALPHGEAVIAPGMWVHINDDITMRRVMNPVVQIGDPNYDPTEFGLWTRGVTTRSNPDIGGLTANGILFRLVSADGMTDSDIYTRPPTEEDARQIGALKGEAWRLGMEAKRNHSWCPSFESSMSLLGLSENVTYTAENPDGDYIGPAEPFPSVAESPYANGAVLNSGREVCSLPDGAVVMYPASGSHDEGDWCYLQVNRASANGQAHILGTNHGRHTTTGVVLYNGVGEMRMPIPSVAALDMAPVGTRIGHGSSRPYIKQADGRWGLGNGGDVAARDFFAGATTQYTFRAFPRLTA
jgi:hypothetical protein